MNFKKLGPIVFSKKGNGSEIVLLKNSIEERIFFKKADSDGKRSLLKSFTDKFSKTLGPTAEEIMAKDLDTIQEDNQRLIEAEKQLEQAATLTAKKSS